MFQAQEGARIRWKNRVLLSPYYLGAASCDMSVHQESDLKHKPPAETTHNGPQGTLGRNTTPQAQVFQIPLRAAFSVFSHLLRLQPCTMLWRHCWTETSARGFSWNPFFKKLTSITKTWEENHLGFTAIHKGLEGLNKSRIMQTMWQK